MQDAQIHIDLETLDTTPTARILSIGAVCRCSEFYEEVDQSTYTDAFTISKSTTDWWQARGGFVPRMSVMSVYAALTKLSVWIHDLNIPADDMEIWANSPAFDCAILHTHFKHYALAVPWEYYMERDVRTIKGMVKVLRLGVPKFENSHNALDDARNQQAYVDRVYKTVVRNYALARDVMQGLTPSGLDVY